MSIRPLRTLSQGLGVTGSLIALLIAAPLTVHAQIVNGGFETPAITGTFQNFTTGSSIGAWTVVGTAGISVSLINTAYSEASNGMTAFQSQEGVQSFDLTRPGNVGTTAGV